MSDKHCQWSDSGPIIKSLNGVVLNLICKIIQYLGYRTLSVAYIKFEMHNCISLGCLLVLIFKSIGMGQTLNHLVIIDISTLAFQQYPVQHTSLASSVANWIFFIKVITCMCQDYWPRFRNLLKSLILLINWGDSVCNNFATCGFGLDISFLCFDSFTTAFCAYISKMIKLMLEERLLSLSTHLS